jgi:hypothetical protein
MRATGPWLGMLLFCACGVKPLTVGDVYMELKPIEQLSERERSNQPDNLVVRIHNVADERASFKNYVVLYVNGRVVQPTERLNNFSSTYSYPMRLREGVYDIRAEYHVVGYWRERVFRLVPDEPIKILPQQRTTLEVRLKKSDKGSLADSQTGFRVRYDDLAAVASQGR